jgi:anti-sigma factor RsiW
MKECWSEGELRAYLDRELPPEDMERVAAHVDVCSECGDLWAELAGRAARVSALMDSLPVPDRTVSISRAPRRAGSTRWRWSGAVVALAAGLVLGIVAMPKRVVAPAVLPPVTVRATPDTPLVGPPDLSPMRVSTAAARPGRVRPAQHVKRNTLPEVRSSEDFVSLDDEPISTGVVLRVELGPKGIPADVIFGSDGRPHAIRLVNSKSNH